MWDFVVFHQAGRKMVKTLSARRGGGFREKNLREVSKIKKRVMKS